jgi:hypothetical protein
VLCSWRKPTAISVQYKVGRVRAFLTRQEGITEDADDDDAEDRLYN